MDLIERQLKPRYYVIYEQLFNDINEAKYQPGEKLPSESELCDKYKVSRGTVREAMKLLFQQGLLSREQGRGTFVTSRAGKILQDAQLLMGFTELMNRHNKKASAKLLKITKESADKKIRNLLNLDDNANVVKIERLRFGDDEPLIIERSYFVYELFEPLLSFDIENESIYEILYRETETRLGDARQTIEAVTASVDECRLLKIEPGSPLLLIKRLIKTKNGRFFQYSEDLYRSDKLNFVVKTSDYDENRSDFDSPLVIGAKGD